jgi:hypothetical protein
MKYSIKQGLSIILFCLLGACGGGENKDKSTNMVSMQAAPATDTVVFGGKRSEYFISKVSSGANGVVVTDSAGNNVDVAGASSIKFADVSVNLSIAGLARGMATADLNSLIELYIAFFNRVPDADGLAYWMAQRKAGMSLDAIAQSFYSAALEYAAVTGYSAAMTDEDFVKVIYKNVLGRSGTNAPPDEDVQYWAGELKNGRSKASMIGVMLNSAHSYANDPTWGWVPNLLDNKIAVGRYFAIDGGLNYNTPEDSISKGIAIAAAVTPGDIAAAEILIPGEPFNPDAGATIPAGSIGITMYVPDLVKLTFKGSELKGKVNLILPRNSSPIFDVVVHPGFVWTNISGANYSGGKLSFTTPLAANRAIEIAMPKLADPSRPNIVSATYDRSAIYRDELNKTAMNIEVFAAVSSSYKVVLSYTGLDPLTRQDVSRDIQLMDDGVGADKRAGDYRFTTSFKTELLPRYEYMGVAAYEGRVHVVDASGNDVGSAGQVKTGMSMVVVDRAKTAAITKLADDVYVSKSVVNVVVQGTSFRFTGSPFEADFSPQAMKRVLAFYPDVFDHASFFYAGNVGPVIGSEFAFRLKNNVTGIGDTSHAQWLDATQYGSNTLEAATELTGGTTGPYIHEFTHRFGFYLNDPRLPLAENVGCQCHLDSWNQIIWDPILGNGYGGTGILQTADGNWVPTPFHGEIPYTHSDIMLYLMGLIAPNELPAQPWVIDPSGKLPPGSVIPGSKVKIVTIADIEAVYGKRSPAYGIAPTTFHDVIVLITSGRPALPEEITAIEMQANFYASKDAKSPNIMNAGWQNGLAFYDSTKGRGAFVTALPPRK